MNKARLISTVFVLVCLIATVSYLPGAYASSQVSLVPVNPSGSYRWLDVAGQAYGSTYQQTYTYSQATVNVAYDTTGSSLRGTLTATNLKPNFAYQLKLEGTPGTAGNEKIGYTGRWWEEEWSGVAWVNGQNIVDQTYIDNQNELYSDSPPVNLYRFTGYLLFDYFIT